MTVDAPTTTPPTSDAGATPTPTATPPANTPPSDAGATPDVKAMEAALKKANKEAETARLALKAREDEDKTEAQKASEAATAAEARAAKAETELMRLRVATAKGLPAELAGRLTGDTEAEMTADADALLAVFGTPRSLDLGQGNKGTPAAGDDMNSLLRRAAGK